MKKIIFVVAILLGLVFIGYLYQMTSKTNDQNIDNKNAQQSEVNVIQDEIAGQNEKVDITQDEIIEQNEIEETEDCTNLADLPNEYGCHPSMYCDEGQVCREGLCIEEENAPNEYGCHPGMYCNEGQVCRDGLCVDSQDAPDEYGCHPNMICGNSEVCRDGICIKICD